MKGPPLPRSLREAGNEVGLGGSLQSITDTSVASQRMRLLAHLRHDSITTIEARRDLNVLHPAMRIKELREDGHNVVTRLMEVRDDYGRKHSRVALYSLRGASNERTR